MGRVVKEKKVIKLPACGFFVESEAGKLPIKIEKRAKGKRVTILSEIVGSAKAALITLQAVLGVGGSLATSRVIELQGDQEKRLIWELKRLGATDLSSENDTKAPQSIPDSGISSFLRKTEALLSKRKIEDVYVPSGFDLPESCIKIHGDYWPYCVGTCVNVDLSDVYSSLEDLKKGEEISSKHVEIAEIPDSAPKVSTGNMQNIFDNIGLLPRIGSAVKNVESITNFQVTSESTQKLHGRMKAVPLPSFIKCSAPRQHRIRKKVLPSPQPLSRPDLPPFAWVKRNMEISCKLSVTWVAEESGSLADLKKVLFALCGPKSIKEDGDGLILEFSGERDKSNAREILYGMAGIRLIETDDECDSEPQITRSRHHTRKQEVNSSEDEMINDHLVNNRSDRFDLGDLISSKISAKVAETPSLDIYETGDTSENYGILSEGEWETVRLLQLEKIEEFWDHLYSLVENGLQVSEAFTEAVTAHLESRSLEVENDSQEFEIPHHLWRQLTPSQFALLELKGFDESPGFWGLYEIMLEGEEKKSFEIALNMMEEKQKKNTEPTLLICPVCNLAKFKSELDLDRHIDNCLSSELIR